MMKVRKTSIDDLACVMPIYEAARAFMVRTGNPDQWINGYPANEDILRDIDAGVHYVILNETDDIVGAFMFKVGRDATYDIIERGSWLNDDEYGVVHIFVSNGKY